MPSVFTLVRELVLHLALYGHEASSALAARLLRWPTMPLVWHALRGHLDTVDRAQLAAFGQHVAGEASSENFLFFVFCFCLFLLFFSFGHH